jgi:protein MpaA
VKSSILGRSVQGLPIWGFHFGTPGSSAKELSSHVLIVAATHGDEIESVILAEGLLAEFHESFPYRLQVTVIPALNVDGVRVNTRWNARGVDLNRNLPTHDWTPEIKNPRYPPGPFACSEPENQSLVRWLEANKPDLILSLHSFSPCLNINGNCRLPAEVLGRWTGYPLVEDMGYPTPGCLGTYAGIEREMPTITYEIERGSSPQTILSLHIPAIRECLKSLEG